MVDCQLGVAKWEILFRRTARGYLGRYLDLGVDGWILLGWISKRWDVGIWSGLGWPRIETVGGRL